MASWDQLLGPLGLLVGLLVAVGALWRSHTESDTDLRRDRDEWKQIARTAVDSNARLADALEERNRIDEALVKARQPR